jgi:hypothetical protein
VDKHQTKTGEMDLICLCADSYFVMKSLSAALLQMEDMKAETVSFLSFQLTYGVSLSL